MKYGSCTSYILSEMTENKDNSEMGEEYENY